MIKLLEINGTANFAALGEVLFVENVPASSGVISGQNHLRILYSSSNNMAKDLNQLLVILNPSNRNFATLNETVIKNISKQNMTSLSFASGPMVIPGGLNKTLKATIVN